MEVVNKGTFFRCTFSRMYIFDLWHTATGSYLDRAHHIIRLLEEMLPDGIENLCVGSLHSRIKSLSRSISAFWKKQSRFRSSVIDKYSKWLNVVETIDVHKVYVKEENDVEFVPESVDCVKLEGYSVKDEQTEEAICEAEEDLENNVIAISEAAESASLYKDHNVKNEVIMGPEILLQQKILVKKKEELKPLAVHENSEIALSNASRSRTNVSTDEMLDLVEKTKLTEQQYLVIRNFFNNKFSNKFLPSYESVLKAKKR